MKPFFILLAVFGMTNASAGIFGDPKGYKKDCLESHSRAWCAVDAANIAKGFDDFKKGEVFKNTDPSAIGTVLDIGMVTATATGWVPATPGLSNGAVAGLLVLTALTDRKPKVLGGDQMFGWMPMEAAATPDEALRLFYEHVSNATSKVLSEYVVTQAKKDEPGKPVRGRLLEWDVKGGVCSSDSACKLVQPDWSVMSPKPTEGVAPEWMGGYKAWVFDGSKGWYGGPNLKIDGTYWTYSFAGELSKHLPSWMWISVSPGGTFAGAPRNPGLQTPLVFNEGKVLVPIYPEVAFKQEPFKLVSAPLQAANQSTIDQAK